MTIPDIVSSDDWTPTDTICSRCSTRGQCYVRTVTSSCGGYDDYQYKCFACGNQWWADGSDA